MVPAARARKRVAKKKRGAKTDGKEKMGKTDGKDGCKNGEKERYGDGGEDGVDIAL